MENNINNNINTGATEVVEPVESNNITLEDFKNALENNIEVKGYFDSLCDKTVNSRLDKSINTWKEKNLNNLIEEEINKRYPQKTEDQIKFEEKQKELKKAIEEKEQLQLQIKYQSLMAENNLPLDVLEFVAGKDIKTTIDNINKFKHLLDSRVEELAQQKVKEKLGSSNYMPPISADNFGAVKKKSLWDI